MYNFVLLAVFRLIVARDFISLYYNPYLYYRYLNRLHLPHFSTLRQPTPEVVESTEQKKQNVKLWSFFYSLTKTIQSSCLEFFLKLCQLQ